MKTLPARPANIPAPPDGYVFLGHRREIKVPKSWDEEYSSSYADRMSFASYCIGGSLRWNEWDDIRAHKDYNGYLAAKPNSVLYNLNKDLLPMNALATPVKTLKYKIVTRQNGLVAVQITEQSHRNDKFGEKGSSIFGKLESINAPENAIGTYRAMFFVRGNRPTQDNEPMLFTSAEFERFEKEVAAYNAHFSKPAILKVVFFKYNGGSIRGYRKVQVVKEDLTYIEGYDADKGEYRKYLKSKIVGNIDTIKA